MHSDENLGWLNKHIYSSIFLEVSLCWFGSCILNIDMLLNVDMLVCSEGSLWGVQAYNACFNIWKRWSILPSCQWGMQGLLCPYYAGVIAENNVMAMLIIFTFYLEQQSQHLVQQSHHFVQALAPCRSWQSGRKLHTCDISLASLCYFFSRQPLILWTLGLPSLLPSIGG